MVLWEDTILEIGFLTASPVSRPFTVTPYVHFVLAAAAVFCLSTMKKDIFIPQPSLPLGDVSRVTTGVVTSNVRCTIRKKNEPQRSKNDEDRAVARFSHITTITGALVESSASQPNESSLSKGKGLKVSSQRIKPNLFEPNSSKIEGERALASFPCSITSSKATTTFKAPSVRQNRLLYPSIDRTISIGAMRSFEMLNELCSSKSDKERAETKAL